jgi:Methyltransferase domain
MERQELIQAVIKKNKFKNYLEIGVLNGYIFFQIKCKNKTAVDPFFQLQAIRHNLTNIRNKYFEKKSNDFFAEDAPSIYKPGSLDIAFVDGMHEFSYALKDAENCLKYIADNGIIILHDCNPQSAEAECSFADWENRKFAGEWNGDTWKAITYLIRNRPDLDIFTIDADYGLGIITKAKQPRPNCKPTTFEEIDALSYDDLNNNRQEYLNLQSVEFAKNKLGI